MNKKELKKDLILSAASDCFSRFGYEKTTLDDIGKATKLNKASLYYYFKSKEDIFIAVILQESKTFIEGLQKKIEREPFPEDKIIQYLIERLRYYKKVINLNQLSVAVLHQIEPLFDQLYNNILAEEIDFITLLLKEAFQPPSGEFPIELNRVAEALIDAANGLKHEAVRKSGAAFASEIDYQPVEEKIALIARLMMAGLKTSAFVKNNGQPA